jgi:hypothetical protein
LNHLIGTLASLGVDHLHTGSMLTLFGGSALLPTVKHDCDGVMLAMSIGCQIMQQHFAGGFRVSRSDSATSQ